jgi:hypothetical protein
MQIVFNFTHTEWREGEKEREQREQRERERDCTRGGVVSSQMPHACMAAV